MRYRRLSYRYTMVLTADQLRPLGAALPALLRAGSVAQLARPQWSPLTDVYESPDAICITIELAGVDQDELDVLLFEDAVVVEGQRRIHPAERNGRFHAVEIQQGPFRVAVPLPAAVDPERVDARYERGLLHITLKKAGTSR